MTPRSDDRAERLYCRFLALYPRRFRNDYEEPLRQLFRDLLDDPTMPRWRIWLGVLSDIPGSIVPEQFAAIQGGAMMTAARWLRAPSARSGIILGLVLGLVWTVYNVINSGLNLDEAGYAVLNNGLMVALVLCFAGAGFIGARQVGTVRAGAAAGIVTALVASVIGIATLWLVTWLFFAQIHQNTAMIHDFHHSGAQSMDAFIIEDALGATVFGTLLVLALGALIGTVSGGLAKLSLRFRAA